MRERTDWIGDMARDAKTVARLVREARRRGYAVNRGEWDADPDFAAVALPVTCGDRLLASINLVFPKGAVPPEELSRKYLPRLQQLTAGIGKNSRAWIER